MLKFTNITIYDCCMCGREPYFNYKLCIVETIDTYIPVDTRPGWVEYLCGDLLVCFHCDFGGFSIQHFNHCIILMVVTLVGIQGWLDCLTSSVPERVCGFGCVSVCLAPSTC